MKINPIHSFDVSLDEMRAIQHSLRQQIRLTPYLGQPRLVAGVDLAYFPDNQQAVAVIAIMDFASKQLVETVHCQDTVSQEYIPGFLAFRELPLFLKAWEQVQSEPDLVFFDGNGMLHPERVGLATHASVFIDKPTIGIAKNTSWENIGSLGPSEEVWSGFGIKVKSSGLCCVHKMGSNPFMSP
jgi:deoxyribonuclease V